MIKVKALLEQYAAYNLWANERLLATVLSLDEIQQRQAVPGSFPTLHDTLLHMLDASSVWWQRIKMNEIVTWPGKNFKGDTADAIKEILYQDKLWESWITQAGEALLDHVFHYQNSKKEKFRQPTYEMLLHLFNHSTYHRGQIVTALRFLQVDTVPATDFIVFTRLKK